MRLAMRRVALSLTWLVLVTPVLAADKAAHWAFRPPQKPALPHVATSHWVRTPVDAFILARLEQAGLEPAASVDRAMLLRRVTYDLTGLPPTAAELDSFLQDTRPDAYVRVVERLLASPHHGERWAQHWLDVARYAESNGYESDGERPHAWRYRDYVVSSLNEDKPYDRFLTEQIAGDLLAKPALGQGIKGADRPEAQLLIAAGFNRCGPVHQTSGNIDPAVSRQEVLTEMTNGVGGAFLALTLGCARCHDHKFDPLPQRDYYRLQAFFAPAIPAEVEIAHPEEKAAHGAQLHDLNARIEPLRRQINEIDAPYRDRLMEAKKLKLEPAYREALAVDPKKRTPEQVKLAANAQILVKVTWDEILAAIPPADRARRGNLREQLHALETQRPPPPAQAWTVSDNGTAPACHVLKRGDPNLKDAEVKSGFPASLNVASFTPTESTRGEAPPPLTRIDLARWLTRPDHPLTARVIVNRLWQHHFGRGLVATPNDFGIRGERPSHPELLDWLATELVQSGWSLKHMHRLMVLSATYQQRSTFREPVTEDADNRLLWRMNRRRLEGESLRDSTLSVAGTLNPALGGPMVRVPLEPEVYDLIFTEGEPDGLWHVTPDPRQHTRRSLYLFAKRNVRQPLFEAFDQPDTLTSCPVRPVSTFAPQALILFNGPFMQEQSKAFAARLLREAPAGRAARIELAYRLALARPPRADELKTAERFLGTQAELIRERLLARKRVGLPASLPEGTDPAEAAALADFCLALLNRNEFLYVP
jgi:hypothetical protein